MKLKVSLLLLSVSFFYTCSNDDEKSTDSSCYSPTQNLTIAYEIDSIGCDCDSENDSDICVQDENGRKVALICSENKCLAVEDGPCFSSNQQ